MFIEYPEAPSRGVQDVMLLSKVQDVVEAHRDIYWINAGAIVLPSSCGALLISCVLGSDLLWERVSDRTPFKKAARKKIKKTRKYPHCKFKILNPKPLNPKCDVSPDP